MQTLTRAGQGSKVISVYLPLYKQLAEPYLESDVNRQLVVINGLYEKPINSFASKEVTQANFDDLENYLKKKSLDILMSTGSSEYLTDNTSFYYNVSPLYLHYYNQVSLRELEQYIVCRSYDDSICTTRNFLVRKLEQTLEFDKASAEDDAVSMATDLDRDELVLEEPSDTIEVGRSKEEVISYWRYRWYLLYASFLNDDYKSVVTEFTAMLDESLNDIAATSVLQCHFKDVVVSKTNLLRIICFSFLIVKSNTGLQSFWKVPVVEEALSADLILSTIVKSYIAGKYGELHRTMDILGSQYRYDYQLSKVFPNVQRIIRFKVYITYLSLIKRATIQHMADIFDVPVDSLEEELDQLIRTFKLHVSIHDGIIECVPQVADDLVSRLYKLDLAAVNDSNNLEISALVARSFPMSND